MTEPYRRSMTQAYLSFFAALAVVVGTASASSAQAEQAKGGGAAMVDDRDVQLLVPEGMPKSVGYSQLATARGGTVVFVSGQVALDKAENLIGKDDFRAQIRQVFENLKTALEAAGGSFRDVIKLNSYLLDFSHLAEFREVRDSYIDVSHPPASTAVQVQRLFRPEFLVEIEAVAVVPSKSGATHR